MRVQRKSANHNIKIWILGVFMVIMTWYSPVELTRILLLINAGHSIVLPWYWIAEICAIWIGYAIGGLTLWYIMVKRLKK